VVLHSSAPGAAIALCTRSQRDLPDWVGASVPVGFSSGVHITWPCGPVVQGRGDLLQRGPA
jgi:hypothetical protein